MSTNSEQSDQASIPPVQVPAKAPRSETQVQPLAKPAHMKRRHWGLLASFFLLVLAPVVAVGLYLFAIAEDQYSSTVGFTVRQEEAGGASELLGGLASFAGGSTGSDRDILYEFIQSQGIVERIDAKLDLTTYYAKHWETDPVFSIWPDATIEDLVWFWQRVVRISYDQTSGLIKVQVLAFDPEIAQRIAQEIVNESQSMINALNTASRDDAMRYAQAT